MLENLRLWLINAKNGITNFIGLIYALVPAYHWFIAQTGVTWEDFLKHFAGAIVLYLIGKKNKESDEKYF